MISVCLIYSDERKDQASQVVQYIKSLPYAISFDLIQVCDGPPKHTFTNFRTVTVVRKDHEFFCRADLWNAGISEARRRVVIILDCDRIAHPDFFTTAATLGPKEVLYCPRLYQLLKYEPTKTIMDHFSKPVPLSFARPDFRVTFENGTIKPAKNPMSGCVAFVKKDYLDTPGISPEFVGWGFNDTDFYAQAYFSGFKFRTLEHPEFHIFHEYEVSRRRLLAMNTWNSVKFYDKWRLPTPVELTILYRHFNVTPAFLRQVTLKQFLEITR